MCSKTRNPHQYLNKLLDALEKKSIENKKKRIFHMPDEPGVHFIKQQKISRMSQKSSSAMAFREQMMNRHNRQSAQARKQENEKKKYLKKK